MATNFQVIRIPDLPNLEEKAGTLYIPTYKVNDDTTYRILVDLLGGATDTTPEWSSKEIYPEDDIVEWNLKLWKSLIDENENNTPAENEYWTEVSKAEGGEGINYWSAGVYTNNPTLIVYDKNLFLLNTSEVTMPFESSDFQLELTQNKWLQLTGNDIDAFVGTGALSDPVWTVDDVNDTVTIQQNQFVVYEDAKFAEKTIPEKTLNLTLESEQFVVVKKVSGEWVYDITTAVGDIDSTHIAAIPVLTINYHTLDTTKTAHVIDWNSQALNGVNREIDIRVKEKRFRRLEGLGVSLNASREVTVSAAKIAYGLNKKEIPDANSVSGKMWQIVWNGTNWDFTEVTTINNTQYQGDTGLVDLDNNEYGCYFLFRGVEDQEHLYVMFGSDSFSIIDAREQDFPASWPAIIESHAIPVARIIYEKNSNDAEIRLAYGGVLSPGGAVTGASVTVHGNLTGRSESNQHPAAAIQDNAERLNLGTPNPSALPAVLDAIDSKIGGIDSSLWEPETFLAATTDHPRLDDSGDPDIYGRDTFGFGALPGGIREDSGTFIFIGERGRYWSTTEATSTNAWLRGFIYNYSPRERVGINKKNGLSIRLVRPYDAADGDKKDGRILYDTFSDFDGNTYDGVIIGDQVWSTTDLKTTSYADGTAIPTGYNDTDWSNLTTGAYTVYDYTLVSGIDSEAEMIAAYGLLYNWYTVDDSRGLSSDGNVPTDAQFTQLTDYIIANYPDIDSTNIGDHLKSVRQVNSPFEAESDEYIKPKVNELTGEKRYVKAEWIEGATSGGLASTWEDSITEIRAITEYSNNIDVGDYETGIIYQFDEASTAEDDGVDVLRPNDIDSADPGRWINKIELTGDEIPEVKSDERVVTKDSTSVNVTKTLQEMEVDATPLSSADWSTGQVTGITGEKGQFAWDDEYKYECTGTDTWRRVSILEQQKFNLYLTPDIDDSGGAKTSSELETAYPDALIGQRVWGTDLYLYEKKTDTLWKKIAQETA